ncbi:hypothetical protein L226DRAFT_68596 [Lentinus tigrinus ALCF2SS1-7]|uniref:uncharacterized protein n=1 Tax=Lentinus tigrinus ALCF2SS1-7 TaxID=1328758 RepID=UPI0011663AEF|nr:hypothetical protein L226DRAFT_68596 [Lentinus tigrinus ALCF2SS1-7]
MSMYVYLPPTNPARASELFYIRSSDNDNAGEGGATIVDRASSSWTRILGARRRRHWSPSEEALALSMISMSISACDASCTLRNEDRSRAIDPVTDARCSDARCAMSDGAAKAPPLRTTAQSSIVSPSRRCADASVTRSFLSAHQILPLIVRCSARGGHYVCRTSHRPIWLQLQLLSNPHDRSIHNT